MAISQSFNNGMSGGFITDSRLYDSQRDAYEREMYYRRMKEDEYRRMQNAAYNIAPQEQQVNKVPKPVPYDPLAFLSKADNKLLLTGEPS